MSASWDYLGTVHAMKYAMPPPASPHAHQPLFLSHAHDDFHHHHCCWLLTFSLADRSVTCEHLRLSCGLLLEECCVTRGVRHQFVLLGFTPCLSVRLPLIAECFAPLSSRHAKAECRQSVVRRAVLADCMLRLRRVFGISPASLAGLPPAVLGVDAVRSHPAFRIMAERARMRDRRLRVWARRRRGVAGEAGEDDGGLLLLRPLLFHGPGVRGSPPLDAPRRRRPPLVSPVVVGAGAEEKARKRPAATAPALPPPSPHSPSPPAPSAPSPPLSPSSHPSSLPSAPSGLAMEEGGWRRTPILVRVPMPGATMRPGTSSLSASLSPRRLSGGAPCPSSPRRRRRALVRVPTPVWGWDAESPAANRATVDHDARSMGGEGGARRGKRRRDRGHRTIGDGAAADDGEGAGRFVRRRLVRVVVPWSPPHHSSAALFSTPAPPCSPPAAPAPRALPSLADNPGFGHYEPRDNDSRWCVGWL